ncbi:tyrosine-type recombinase/integrase [Halomonas sp. M20]|uniref:tyrosine-type recombinase/integrase n=1 Tax=Halomonas sp. M20 TaxID=2763264 RepID=UPI001D0B9F4A|nr:site-specific integrase [Halomonas sp. M20]
MVAESKSMSKAMPTTVSAHIVANSDAQAVEQWLKEYTASAQTFRAYRKEAERLLLWLDAQRLSLASVDRRRLDEFEGFLTNPLPAEQWVGPPRPRSHPDWRPFRCPLTAASRRQSLIILQGLFSWLVEAGWVAHNPFRLMRDKRRRLDNRQEEIERYLERPLWDWLWQWLNRPLEESASSRAHFLWRRRRLIFGFAYLLAPRISEMASARMGDFFCREGRWWWRVIGKGDKLASIPVPADMLTLLGEWREHLGLTALPEADESGSVLRGLNGKRSLGDNQLYRLIKMSFKEAAQEIEIDEGGAVFAQTLRKATPHWLRHTAITHQAQAGIELRYLAKTARHSRLDTTARYLHTEADEWQRQLAAHQLESRRL